MIFTQTPLESAFVVDPESIGDDRGFFTRAFCANEFEAHGLKPAVVQTNMSYNHRKGTIRGLHYQRAPAAEAKFMRCISGAIWDVIVDLRPGSPTHMQHFGVELSAENRRALYVPERFAHGYLSLSDGAEVLYTVSEFYTPGVEGGYRFDDPALGIEWPIPVDVISEKDASWPLIGS
jgi:dTDP-4-dehydrorhamnose 3,5-epimerase